MFFILFSPTYTLYLCQKGELKYGQYCPYRSCWNDNYCFIDFERLASFIKNGTSTIMLAQQQNNCILTYQCDMYKV